MITITDLFHKVVINEQENSEQSSEAIGHLPHIVEGAIHARPDISIRHLRNAIHVIQGKDSEGSLSQKADGKVSIVFGKENGIPFVQYKGRTSPKFKSKEEIEHFIASTGKDYLRDSFHMGFDAASHPRVGHNSSYQADTIVDHDYVSAKGNIVKYKKPSLSTKAILAVHTEFLNGKKLKEPSDVSFLSTDTTHFPNLSMKGRNYTYQRHALVASKHLQDASKIFDDEGVKQVMQEVASHRGPTKTSHRHLLLREFNNKYQNGKVSGRSFDHFMNFAKSKLDSTTNKNEKARLQEHINYFSDPSKRQSLEKMFEGHARLDKARDLIIKSLNNSRPELKPVVDAQGNVDYNQNEGYVSTIHDESVPEELRTMKLVPREFSIRNSRESAARRMPVKEEMTASSGGISGMGYNIGGPAPDDVAVPPLKNRMASKAAKPFRRKLMTKLLGKLNVGREAY